MKAKNFLTSEAQKAITDAIFRAEKNTSGEIRVHIDEKCDCNPEIKAQAAFARLGMDRTEKRNGVLIYIACESKVFAIIGDKGINEVVPEGFWNDIIRAMQEEFRRKRFAEGIILAVEAAGEKLKEYFPYMTDDVNEQPDEISFEGDDKK